jgi:hypothetical protein
MPYARLDDRFHLHPTVVQMGNACAGVYARAISYCAAHLTDGEIPAVILQQFADNKRQIQKLVELGCIEERSDSYYLVDFLRHNDSRADVEKRRRESRERTRRWRDGKQQAAGVVCDASRDALHGGGVTRHVTRTYWRGEVQEQEQASLHASLQAREGEIQEQASLHAREGGLGETMPELDRERLAAWVKQVGVQYEEPGFSEELARLTSNEVLRQEMRRLWQELREAA